MKKLFLLFFLASVVWSCEEVNDSGIERVQVAIPQTMSLAEFRTSTSVENAQPIQQSGKIYAYDDLIFINDQLEGVHVLDNSDPSNPIQKNFLKIPQNTDVAIKDDKLYANSGPDLVVFDLSDVTNIEYETRIENVFNYYYPTMPEGVSYLDESDYDYETEIIIGFEVRTEYREIQNDIAFFDGAEASGGTGTGGSMARFKIVNDYLYTVTESEIHIFDIQTQENPIAVNSEYVGWQIETIFNQGDYLYLGSSSGMYIYSIENPAAPSYVSRIDHVVGCDPVVVQGDWAYVTIRGGNDCGQNLSQLEVIDISNKNMPERVAVYEMEEPYGLGIKDDHLFVCDGSEGLKVFDASATPEISLIDHFENIETYDVIPLENVLLMVGGDMLYQYRYTSEGIVLLSSFSLN
ncbi:LVIVD repeat-containing protein [Mesonia mobilis]|uniref:LVIVD repeat-containing protein n=1 Tax=Mesonia mobilis TaxID=369791 RepID=UPI0026EBC84B|nr:hypothetical protein [Mesonia mobilis]